MHGPACGSPFSLHPLDRLLGGSSKRISRTAPVGIVRGGPRAAPVARRRCRWAALAPTLAVGLAGLLAPASMAREAQHSASAPPPPSAAPGPASDSQSPDGVPTPAGSSCRECH